MWAPKATIVTVPQLPFYPGGGGGGELRACSEVVPSQGYWPSRHFCDLRPSIVESHLIRRRELPSLTGSCAGMF